MSNEAADRNLLLGVLAVQMDFVTAAGLVAGMNAWVLDKRTSLAAHLTRLGALSDDTRTLLEALVDKHIDRHGGAVEQSLAALSSAGELCQQLERIEDADMQATLRRFDTTAAPQQFVTQPFQRRPHSDDERFHILRPHAQGGLGKVSIARDAQLNREVALKELLDAHADNSQSRARFLQEAEITGGLEHPGVVPIYGLGQYADGRPFYAMRFIRGDSLQQAIDRFHRRSAAIGGQQVDVLQLRRLLARLIDVCNAVGYAHSRGVLHRDLKPGNVMLGQYGETLVVDWGLAKPLGEAGTEPPQSASDIQLPAVSPGPIRPSGTGSAPTQMGSAVGTPAFMSPEQAAGRLDQLGPASDIYSLGATLYYLLTGQPPQTDKDLGIVLQRTQRGDFPAPRQLQPAVPRALNAICLKAMSLDPTDRYATPGDMAEDLESWLADEPVVALAEPWAMRSRRWFKKHRTLVASAAAMLVVAAISLAIGVVMLSASNQRERVAKNDALAEQQRAEAAEQEAVLQSRKNEELLALARRSIQHYEQLSKSELLTRYGMESLRTDLLQTAVDYYATLAGQGGDKLQDRADRAFAEYRLGMTYWGLGDVRQAEAALRRSLAERQALHNESPSNVDFAADAGGTSADLGELLSVNQRGEEAAEHLAEAINQFQQLSQAHPDRPRFRVQQATAKTFEAERIRRFGQLQQASTLVGEAIALYRDALANVDHQDAEFHQEVRLRTAQALMQLGALETAEWEFKSSADRYDEAATLLGQVQTESPDNVAARFALAQVLSQQAQLASRQNQIEEALSLLLAASGEIAKLDQEYPDVLRFRRMDADLLHSRGLTHNPTAAEWMTDERLQLQQSAVDIAADLASKYPDDTDLMLSLARYRGTLGLGLSRLGRTDESQQQFAAARQALQEHVALGAGNIESLFSIAQQQGNLAYQLYSAGDADGALALFDQSEQQWGEVLELAPQLPEAQLSLAQLYLNRADIYLTHYHLREGVAELDKLIEKSAELSQVGDAAWMSAGFNIMVAGAKVQRWNSISHFRSQGFGSMIDDGRYGLLLEQLAALPEITDEPSDHFLAAQLLCRAAVVARAAADDSAEAAVDSEVGAEEDSPAALVDRIESAAVGHLSDAWKAGYIRRRSGLTTLFSSRPSVETLRKSDQFASLRERDDFLQLLAQIDATATDAVPEDDANADPAGDSPPQPTAAPDGSLPAESAAATTSGEQSLGPRRQSPSPGIRTGSYGTYGIRGFGNLSVVGRRSPVRIAP